MTRAALYARYSSDQQSACSIEDQLRICREQAIRNGWQIANDYTDAAISGSSIVLRPGIRALLEDAQAGRFEKFAFIEQHACTWPVNVMCRMLGVSRSGYYDWRGRAPSTRTMANLALLGDVRRLQA